MKGWIVLASGLALGPGTGAASEPACGDALCPVEGGGYALLLPEGGERPGIFVYLHGYAATAEGAAGHAPLTEPVLRRGMAFLAVEGQPETLSGKGLDWGVADGFTAARDDHAYLARVIDDAAARFGLDRDRVLLAGYSRGGSLVWDIACAEPGLAAAYASYAGAFWEPMPESCGGPVHLYHAHGFADRTVPVEGQEMTWYGHDFEMGDVQKALGIWRGSMGCPMKADASDTAGAVWIKRWTACGGGSLTYALGPGNHGRPETWVTDLLDWFEALPD